MKNNHDHYDNDKLHTLNQSSPLPHKSCLGLGLHRKQPQIIPSPPKSTKAHLGGRIRPAQVTSLSLPPQFLGKLTNHLRPRSSKWSLTPKCTAYLSCNIQKRYLRPSSSWTHKSVCRSFISSYFHRPTFRNRCTFSDLLLRVLLFLKIRFLSHMVADFLRYVIFNFFFFDVWSVWLSCWWCRSMELLGCSCLRVDVWVALDLLGELACCCFDVRIGCWGWLGCSIDGAFFFCWT